MSNFRLYGTMLDFCIWNIHTEQLLKQANCGKEHSIVLELHCLVTPDNMFIISSPNPVQISFLLKLCLATSGWCPRDRPIFTFLLPFQIFASAVTAITGTPEEATLRWILMEIV